MKMSNTTRKLQDTSWLAQLLRDKMDVEFDKNGGSARWKCLQIFHIIINEADNAENENIYYDNYNGKRSITIRNIPSMIMEHGFDFDTNGMQCKLRGLAASYTDDNGMYLISVLTTNDLNSCVIKDVSELVFQLGTH